MQQPVPLYPYRVVQAPLDVEVEPITASLSPLEWTRFGHRQSYAQGFVIVAGAGSVLRGESESSFAAPCLIWLPSGHGGRVRLAAGTRGSAISVGAAALERAIPAGPMVASLRQAIDLPLLGVGLDRRRAGRIVAALEAIGEEVERDEPGGRVAVTSHLTLLLIALWRLGDPSTGDALAAPRVLVQDFLQLVELHLREHWRIGRYAAALGVSTDWLGTAVQRATGLTPMALIHRRLLEEAEALLERSTLQVKEVGDALGFRDAAYFSRFFTRATGVPPGRFRQRAQRQRLRPDGSFAAWP
ncbi:helix-turn-helix domain-containing protein [Devosia sp.]|uniref:helix-turn-helix domain-containing protein n=1 Tax=Devosia sp. TaxID=1871048 RepID=UPI002EF1AD7C